MGVTSNKFENPPEELEGLKLIRGAFLSDMLAKY